jgi:hypothetical protein
MPRRIRFLMAWMEQAEAIGNCLGRVQTPNDDVAQYIAAWEAARGVLAARNPYQLEVPVLREMPPELAERSMVFQQRPDVIAAFQGLDWTVGIADLTRVLSFQKFVVDEQAVERVMATEIDDLHGLFGICLPEPAAPVTLTPSFDQDQRGVMFNSPNTNLRLGPATFMEGNNPAAPGQPAQQFRVAGFMVNFGAPFVQIAELNGRWFVRDGYHRCFGLLRRGTTQIPCIFVRARGFQELGANSPGFFRQELIFGDRPPFLRDFLDDAVTRTAEHQSVRKVVRITGQEFLLEV